MKCNIFLRAAAGLFVACILVSCVFSGTITISKYVAVGVGSGGARVARFDVVEASRKYSGTKTGGDGAGWYSTSTDPITPIPISPNTNNNVKSINNRISNVGTQIEFEMPLFDYEYATRARGTSSTVVSANNNLVIAPGIGFFGYSQKNPNDTDGFLNNQIAISIANRSEVRVRFKIEFDGVRSVLPAVGAARLPLLLYPSGGVVTSKTDTIRCRLDRVPTSGAGSLKNIFMNEAGTGMKMGTAYTNFISNDGWFYLDVGQRTGVTGADSVAVPPLGLHWAWTFDNNGKQSNWPGTGELMGSGYGYGGTNAFVDDALPDPWQGTSSTTYLPDLPRTGIDPYTGATVTTAKVRTDDIDRFDTALGLAAANNFMEGYTGTYAKLVFRITVEQVD